MARARRRPDRRPRTERRGTDWYARGLGLAGCVVRAPRPPSQFRAVSRDGASTFVSRSRRPTSPWMAAARASRWLSRTSPATPLAWLARSGNLSGEEHQPGGRARLAEPRTPKGRFSCPLRASGSSTSSFANSSGNIFVLSRDARMMISVSDYSGHRWKLAGPTVEFLRQVARGGTPC